MINKIKNLFKKKKQIQINKLGKTENIKLDKVLFRSFENAKDFVRFKTYLIDVGYKLEKYVITDKGILNCLFVLDSDCIRFKCALLKKQIPKNDLAYSSMNTDPNLCKYYIGGVCYLDCDKCMYQESYINIRNIQVQSEIYDHKNDNNSSYYEDTKYGRIYSDKYSHLNGDMKLNKERGIF